MQQIFSFFSGYFFFDSFIKENYFQKILYSILLPLCGCGSFCADSNDCLCISFNYAHQAIRVFSLQVLASGGKIILYDYQNENFSDIYKELNPTFALFTPFFFNNLYSKLLQKIHNLPSEEKIALQTCIQKKIKYMEINKTYTCPELDGVLFPFTSEIFGSKLRCAFYSGSNIQNKILDFFRAILLCPLRSCYGQTEIGAASCYGDNFSSGNTIGKPEPGFEFKIIDCPELGLSVNNKIDGKPAPQGELYIRGPGIATKYIDDKENSKITFKEDGWLSTKDISQYDPETQSFSLLDRSNNIKKLSYAKFIIVDSLEKIYEESPMISQIYIHVEPDKDWLIALVFPEATAIQNWAIEKNLSTRVEDLCKNEELRKTILAELHGIATKKGLNSYQHIAQLALFSSPFSFENGCLNSFTKLMRNNIAKVYKPTLDKLYELAGSP